MWTSAATALLPKLNRIDWRPSEPSLLTSRPFVRPVLNLGVESAGASTTALVSLAPVAAVPLVPSTAPACPQTPPGLCVAVYNDFKLLCLASRYHYHPLNTRCLAGTSPAMIPLPPPLPSVPVMQLEPVLGDVPSRPPTPEGLREALQSNSLLAALSGHWDAYGLNSPSSPTPPPTPPVIPSFPTSLAPGELVVFGQDVSPLYAYVVAVGQQALSPSQEFSMREAALGIVSVEADRPGLLGEFAAFFFPSGLENFGDMMERFELSRLSAAHRPVQRRPESCASNPARDVARKNGGISAPAHRNSAHVSGSGSGTCFCTRECENFRGISAFSLILRENAHNSELFIYTNLMY
ncbi:hypothetical protein BDV93DRAFT_510964 [Ceratobasidium sp. AG-I]|nr:hypothetical protein BDV93DRAFT_510964 [Ceratobasidium sp. AG-I]